MNKHGEISFTSQAIRLTIILLSVLLLPQCYDPPLVLTPAIVLYDITSGEVIVESGGPPIDFGTAVASIYFPTYQRRTFKIQNAGSTKLYLTSTIASVYIEGIDPFNFNVPVSPSNEISPNEAVTFDVVFGATEMTFPDKEMNARIVIESNDPQTPLFLTAVKGIVHWDGL